jgi:BirA family biotin operon repressor/biotin-[acetyl-CoA-carboxylase] ligase
MTSSERYHIDRFRHEALEEVGSTNTFCLERARVGDPGPLWVTARRQLDGRGRRGRTWISEPGNLFASLLLTDPGPQEALGSLPIAVALALYRAIAAVGPWLRDRLRIKWPNDILIDGKKISGILIEADPLPNGARAVVIGIGVNVMHSPDNPLYPATTLRQSDVTTSAEDLFAHLYRELALVLVEWDEGRGVGAIVDAWKAHLSGLGQKITVNLPDRSLSGTFYAIDNEGFLHLALPNGDVMRIASGDVFFS